MHMPHQQEPTQISKLKKVASPLAAIAYHKFCISMWDSKNLFCKSQQPPAKTIVKSPVQCTSYSLDPHQHQDNFVE